MQQLISFKELLSKYEKIDSIPYFELLETHEWFDKRRIILERDNSKCKICDHQEATNWEKQKDGSFKYYYVEIKSIAGGNELVFNYLDKITWMHIHHKFYIKDLLPWEYKSEDLITYCNWCHADFHKNNKVGYFENINGQLVELSYSPCQRCFGAGWFAEYKKIQNGVCFRCGGAKFEELIKQT